MTNRTEAVRRGEKDLEESTAKALKQIGRVVARATVKELEHVLKAVGDDAAAAAALNLAIEEADWTLLINPTEEQLAAVARDGAKRALLALGVTDEKVTEQVFQDAADWAKERSAELVGKTYNAAGDLIDNPNAEMAIDDATREELQGLVADAIEEGMSAQDLADAIMDAAAFDQDRAMLIARTEIIRANNAGHLAAFKGSGVVEQKEWSTAEDGDVCDECQGNEDQGPVGLDDDFESGDDAAPAHPNCRCTIVAVVDAGWDEQSDEGDDEDEGDVEE